MFTLAWGKGTCTCKVYIFSMYRVHIEVYVFSVCTFVTTLGYVHTDVIVAFSLVYNPHSIYKHVHTHVVASGWHHSRWCV